MDILDRLAKSKFRSRFKLRAKELEYIKDKGLDMIRSHACDFIRYRVAPSEPANDGKQTPMRGHPVFIAQHTTDYTIIRNIFCSNSSCCDCCKNCDCKGKCDCGCHKKILKILKKKCNCK